MIGAGRGKRLDYLTETQPKPFTEIQGKRILDWVVDAHAKNDVNDVVFIGGYLIDLVKKEYPEFTFRHNDNWQNNNVLGSLLYAEDQMDEGFISSYVDILYTPDVVRRLLDHSADICIAVDTDWLKRYTGRTQHPSSDGEKVTVEGDRITRISRHIPENEAFGEFIGLAKFTKKGAELFKREYNKLPKNHLFDGSIPMNKAYLIHFLQHLLEKGVEIGYVTTHGDYIEVDTLEDHAYAQKHWKIK